MLLFGTLLYLSAPTASAQGELLAEQRRYSDAIALQERETSVTSPTLIEPLVGLADVLIADQRPAAAIEPLRRAINIIRRSDGVYGPQQYDLLLRVIDLQSLVGDLESAAADLTYMQRVSESSYAGDPLPYGRALAEVADWQCRIGEFMTARATYRQSIQLLEAQSERGALVAALRGFARCSLHELSSVGVATSVGSFDAYRGPIVRSLQFDPSNPAFRSHVFRYLRIEGQDALQRAVHLSAALEPKLYLEVLLETGDWFLAKDFIREARRLYAKAEAVARAEGAQDAMQVPQQVLYPMPAAVLRNRHLAAADTTEEFVEVEFTVRGDGHIIDERVIERGPGKSPVMETLGALRAARFRPRMVEGRALVTEGVRFRQSFRRLK